MVDKPKRVPEYIKLRDYVAEYLAAVKSRNPKALERATRLRRQCWITPAAWETELEKQCALDPELQAFLTAARAKIAADFEASQTYLEKPQPWSPTRYALEQIRVGIYNKLGARAARMSGIG